MELKYMAQNYADDMIDNRKEARLFAKMMIQVSPDAHPLLTDTIKAVLAGGAEWCCYTCGGPDPEQSNQCDDCASAYAEAMSESGR